MRCGVNSRLCAERCCMPSRPPTLPHGATRGCVVTQLRGGARLPLGRCKGTSICCGTFSASPGTNGNGVATLRHSGGCACREITRPGAEGWRQKRPTELLDIWATGLGRSRRPKASKSPMLSCSGFALPCGQEKYLACRSRLLILKEGSQLSRTRCST